jgi:hypothetical protein
MNVGGVEVGTSARLPALRDCADILKCPVTGELIVAASQPPTLEWWSVI